MQIRVAGCLSRRFARAPQQLCRGFATQFPTNMVSPESIRARQPKELLRNDPFRALPIEDVSGDFHSKLGEDDVQTNPAEIIQLYLKRLKQDEDIDVTFLVRCVVQLGFLFDSHSFYASADRQMLTGHKHFKYLIHDLLERQEQITEATAPALLYAFACLEYRCAPLMPPLLDAVENLMASWRNEALSSMMISLAMLGVGGPDGPNTFGPAEGLSKDYTGIIERLGMELGARCLNVVEDVVPDVHMWSQAAFALTMCGLYDVHDAHGALLPRFIANACSGLNSEAELDTSGWAQYFIYQMLYCTDVEKPATEIQIKQAVPMWIQERLHHRWLSDIMLQAQPQGADVFQQDVAAALRRTNTQALLNCSAGRDWDEQHCWFAGFVMDPKIALECDSLMPLGPGRPKPSGWLMLKSRVLRKIGFTVCTLHRAFWDHLHEDQKDEQITRLRLELGYVHNKEMAQEQVRQKVYGVKGRETKKKSWAPKLPSSLVSD